MNKLRKSRFLKILCTITAVLSSCLIFFNIFFTFIIASENLIYTDKKQLQQKLYSYIYNYTSSDLMSYLSLIEQAGRNNSAENYNIAEIELYKNKYSPEKSNIYFEIKDDSGNLMLNNTALPPGEKFFSFSSKYESVFDTSLINFSNINYIYNTDTASGPDNDSEGSGFIELSEIKNINTGKYIKLNYYFSETKDRLIYDFCRDILSFLPFDINEISIYQDEFISDENLNTVSNRYSYEAKSIYPKRFSTFLTTNNKHVKINYSWCGSFSFESFLTRLSEASCILFNSETEITELDYKQEENSISEIHISVPVELSVKDIYYTAAKISSALLFFRDNIIVFSIVFVFIFIFSLIFLFYCAGYKKGEEKAVAKGIHKIPFDITVISAAIAEILLLMLIIIGNVHDEAALPLLAYSALLMIIFLLYTMTVRKRAGTLKSNNLTVLIYRKLKTTLKPLSDAKKFRFIIVLTVIVFFAVTAAEALFLLFAFNEGAAAIILIVLRIAELPFIIIFLAELGSLHNAAEKISEGKLNYKINTSLLFGPVKRHAEYLNSISNSVNTEIEKRVKSESFKTELITNVSHDLKTPLTSIVNYIDILKKEKIDNPDAVKYIEIIDRQSQRLKKLTADIVDASKAATGNITVNPESTVLNVLLQQTAGEYSDKLEEKSLTLIEQMPDYPVNVITDGRLLWRIINNLMNNICKYSMPGTRVYLYLEKINSGARIILKNISGTELNINPDELMERFIRGDKSRNTEGSGLGLSIAKSLSEILGAKMNIEIDGDLFKVIIIIPENFNN